MELGKVPSSTEKGKGRKKPKEGKVTGLEETKKERRKKEKKKETGQNPGFTMLRGSSAARKNYGAPVEKLC